MNPPEPIHSIDGYLARGGPEAQSDRDRYRADDDVDLRPLVRPLIRSWKWAAAAAVAGAIAGFGATFFIPPTYEAVATMMLLRSEAAVANGDASIAEYRALLLNSRLAIQAIQKFDLSKAPHFFTPESFLRVAMDVEDIRNTNLLRVKVRLRDAKLAADVATELITGAVTLNRMIGQEEGRSSKDQIKEQLDAATVRLQSSEAHLIEYRRGAQIELLRTDTESMLGERRNLLKLLIDLETERARLARAEEELSHQPPVRTVRRTIDSDPAMQEAARASGQSGRDLLSLQLRDEQTNPVYEQLQQQVAESRTRIAGLERQRQETVRVRKLGESELAELSKLYQKETDLARYETDYSVAKQVYQELLLRHEQARTEVVSNRSELQIVDPPLIPSAPVWPKWNVLTALGAITGLVLSAALISVVGWLRPRQ